MYSSVASYLWTEHRKILTPKESGISCLSCFGLCSHQQARRPLESHFHPGCMEIVLIIKGFQTYEVNGETFSLAGSDVFITWPDEIHSSGAQPESVCEMIWMQVDLSPEKPLFSLNAGRSALLREALLSLPRLFTGDESVCRELRNAFFLLAGQDEFGRFQGEQLLVCALQRLVSLARFKSLFKEETGSTPREYINQVKIRRAQQLIWEGESITETAMALGFATPNYFSVVFRKFTGMTPTEYKKRESDEKDS